MPMVSGVDLEQKPWLQLPIWHPSGRTMKDNTRSQENYTNCQLGVSRQRKVPPNSVVKNRKCCLEGMHTRCKTRVRESLWKGSAMHIQPSSCS
jgi:hypothetical protein